MDAWAPQPPLSWSGCTGGKKRSRSFEPQLGPSSRNRVWLAGEWQAAPRVTDAAGRLPAAGVALLGKAALACCAHAVVCPCGRRFEDAQAFAHHAFAAHGLPRYIAAKLAPLRAFQVACSCCADCDG